MVVGGSRGGPNATRPDAARRARFLPLCFIESVILNVFPGDEGLQEVPPMHRVLKCLHTSNPIHCSSLHGQLSAGVEKRGGESDCEEVCMCMRKCMEG